MLNIGNLQLDSTVLLAPVAGYTDRAFRLVVRAAGHQGLQYTDLIHPRGIQNDCKQARDFESSDTRDQPLGMQIYGNNPDWLIEAAKWGEDHGAKIIDINMGCPVDKVTKTNGGSMLLCNPDRTTRLAEQIVKAVSIPVTAKLRLGWDRAHITAPILARQLENIGISLITIHGRTTSMRFKGEILLDGIAQTVAAVNRIPVIGNGDIKTVEDAVHMMEHTNCAGVMIARAAIKTPWLLHDIEFFLQNNKMPEELTIAQKCKLIHLHFNAMRRYRSDREAISVMRGRIAAYGKSMGHIKPVKEQIRTMKATDEFYDALNILESNLDPSWKRIPPDAIPPTCAGVMKSAYMTNNDK